MPEMIWKIPEYIFTTHTGVCAIHLDFSIWIFLYQFYDFCLNRLTVKVALFHFHVILCQFPNNQTSDITVYRFTTGFMMSTERLLGFTV